MSPSPSPAFILSSDVLPLSLVTTCPTKTHKTNQKKRRQKNKPTRKKKKTSHNNSHFLDVFPKTVIRLPVFTHLSSSQPGPVTRHLVLSAERPVLLVSKISHQQEPLCGTRQKEADRSPELSHYGPQTAEDNRNRLKLCWTIAFEWGCWTLKALLTMKKPLNAQHQAKTRVQYILFPKINPPPSLPPILPIPRTLTTSTHQPAPARVTGNYHGYVQPRSLV